MSAKTLAAAPTPWPLIAPALLLFLGAVAVPLLMTLLLSFHDWGQYKGIETVFILKNCTRSGRIRISTKCFCAPCASPCW